MKKLCIGHVTAYAESLTSIPQEMESARGGETDSGKMLAGFVVSERSESVSNARLGGVRCVGA